MLVNAAKLAELYGIEKRTVTNWVNSAPPCPSVKEGRERRFDTVAVARWREERAAAKAEEAVMARLPGSDEWEAARTRKMIADARLSEIEVAKAEGTLVLLSDFHREIETLCLTLRARVLSIRGRWAPKVIGLSTMLEATQVLDALATDTIAALREPIEDDEPGEEAA